MANYTINNLPNTVSTISDSDIVPLWDSANSRTAKVSVANLTAKKQDLLTFDNTPTENSNNPVKSGGIYEAIANASGSPAIVASSTTLTGATLATNQILRIFFSADVTGSDTSTPLTITYNGTSYPVMAHKDSALISVYAHEVSSGTYKYLQAYTTLEVIFDGTQFVIVGNPIVLSSDNYTIYADGSIPNKLSEWEDFTETVAPYDGIVIFGGLKTGFTGNICYAYVNGVSMSGAGMYDPGDYTAFYGSWCYVQKGDTLNNIGPGPSKARWYKWR